MKTSYLFLAPGFEEVEALTTVDLLRRAGIPVKTVSVIDYHEVTGAHGIEINTDLELEEIKAAEVDAEWLICPGGMPGSQNLAESQRLCEMLIDYNKKGGRIAAICAAPAVVLASLGLLNGREATCYPGFEAACEGATMVNSRVVKSGNIITANGPSSAFDFAMAIVEETMGAEVAASVARDTLYKA